MNINKQNKLMIVLIWDKIYFIFMLINLKKLIIYQNKIKF